jgi:hypothetical protein
MKRLATAVGLLLWLGSARAADLTLCDFGSDVALRQWSYIAGTPKLIEDGIRQVDTAVAVQFDPKGRYHPAYIQWRRPRRDWSQYEALALDVLNPSDQPIPGYVLIADVAWQQKGRTYWNRHNGSTTFPPGKTTWIIPVHGLYRGEAGSRNNDVKRNIDPDQIVRVDFGFGRRGATGRVILDNLRLIKSDRPDGVWAFDFGPPSQPVRPGWTPVSQRTAYQKRRGYGWGPKGGHPWNGAARDVTFPTPLLQDFCEARGYRFQVDVPPGRYTVTVFYENSGYWGGQQARHSVRRIFVHDELAWERKRPEGEAHALVRFENVEPIGVDLWDTYMAPELARPAVFSAVAKQNGLSLRWDADRVWASKVAAVVVHKADDKEAAEWRMKELEGVADTFRSKAVCLDKPAPAFEPSAAWQSKGLVAWPVRIEDTVTPHSVPPKDAPDPDKLRLEALAVRDEFEAVSVAARPLRDLGACKPAFRWTDGPGVLPVDVRVVHYNTRRGFNSIAYRVQPHTLRQRDEIALPAGVTRQFVVKVRIPPDAKPGGYTGTLTLSDADNKEVLSVPVAVDVHDVVLDRETDFLMGFFGLMPPELLPNDERWKTLDRTLTMLRDNGMNAVCGGPSWQLTGWEDGQPVIDYGDVDRFFALLRKHGFTKPINGYGGLRFGGLHNRYQIGPAKAKIEKASGLDYEEAFLRAWKAVDAHARKNGWPLIYYAMCDETRVRDVAERQLEFMGLMAKAATAFPKTIRPSGSYSVHFRDRPTSKDNLLYWHQRFFEVLPVSSLGGHDPTVMAEAAKLGREIHIYNQGVSRYTFGLYQWSEHRKGVRARWQWHLNILHGYQFFDLDGREPDTAMICYGRETIYPTVGFERCREGAEDFYLYNALWRAAQAALRAGRGKQAKAAERVLDRMTKQIALNQRTPPAWYDARDIKARVVAELESLSREE